MKIFRFCAVVVFSTATSITLFGQAPASASNPFVNGEKGFFGYVDHTVIAAAEKMPEENYSFKPTPDVRTFGQILGHIADAQYMFCSMISGQKSPMTDSVEKTKSSKADLVDALKGAQTFCNQAYSTVTDTQAVQMTDFQGRKMTKLSIMSINTAHTDEHYGNLVTYLRLKGIVPPSSEQQGK